MLASPVGLLYIFAPFYKDLARFSRAHEKEKVIMHLHRRKNNLAVPATAATISLF
jgi:hypothetical protein